MEFYVFCIAIIVLLLAAVVWLYLNNNALRRSVQQRDNDIVDFKERCDKAERASKMKDFYVQNMSHEIRTPLNAVMGFSQLLSIPGLPVSDEDKEKYGQHIQNNGRMLMMLVDDILNISDIESGAFSCTMHEERVNEVCRAALASVEYRVQPGVSLDLKTDFDDDFTIYSDSRRIQQVLTNYLTNACKHTKKGSITLSASKGKREGWIEFAVTDTGVGIKPELATNLFDRFVKLNDNVAGTGIGLNICMRIAQVMNGEVSLDTTYTDGARFIFAMPVEKKA